MPITKKTIGIRADELESGDVIVRGSLSSNIDTDKTHRLEVTQVEELEYTTGVYVRGIGTVHFLHDKPLTVEREVAEQPFLPGTVIRTPRGDHFMRLENGTWADSEKGGSIIQDDTFHRLVGTSHYDYTVVYDPKENA